MSTLTETLVSEGLITPERLIEAEAAASAAYSPLASVLVQQRFVDEGAFLEVYGRLHGLEFVSLRETPIEASAARSISAKLAAHYHIVPIRLSSRSLTIAVSDPLDLRAAEDIETNLSLRVERVLACRSDIEDALQRHYGVGADTVERILARSPEREAEEIASDSLDIEQQASDASVVKLVNQLLKDAIKDRATDIHFEVHRSGVVVRRRIDGVLYDTNVSDRMSSLYPSIVSRIKLMAGLNIVERRLPQDGRARVSIESRNFDLRVSIVPAMHGEDIVIRILPSSMIFDLGELGFNKEQLGMLNGMISSPHGILFVTGPTGSGKSTTLYACMSRLNTRERKIITIEDPVEYELRGITQTQINTKIGLTFSHALRSMLRHDPDVMMVGEVRDRETAEIAVQTAMTGHLVLSTLHTNDAAGGAARLIDMGIDPYLITSTVQAFMAQRLVRTICPSCRESYHVDERTLYRGKGCDRCNKCGFWGRVAICEFLTLNDEISELILSKASAHQIRERADELDMGRLIDDGWAKVEQGLTTVEEIMRVTAV
ncbi:MAG: type II/IV secretion system protein [Verrucomicrobia bacterium]|jgi:general secretion pathway protein E|nr:type II/IV secretion system protein [Verrucomicrobiota bacterium]